MKYLVVFIANLLACLSLNAQLTSEIPLDNWMPSKTSLPLLRSGIQTHQQIAYDRAGDNYDHEYFGLYKEANGEVVLFDAYGPGMVSRHHMNIWHTQNKNISIRYYFDDEPTPRVDMDVNTFFTHDNPLGLFTAPFAVYGEWDFRVLYCPMYFQKRLKITLSAEPGGPGLANINPWLGRADSVPGRRSHWYQFTYQLFAERQADRSWEPADKNPLSKSAVNWTDTAWLSPLVKPFQQKIAVTRKPISYFNPGVLTHLQIDLPSVTRELLQNNYLRIVFDGHATPDVLVPLHAFFGIYPDSVHAGYTNFFSHYNPSTGRLACSYVMPFWKNIRLSVEDAAGKPTRDIRVLALIDTGAISRYPAAQTGYFAAAYKSMHPRKEGYDYRYLDVKGRGHIIGHNALRYNTSMEENERTYFDGSRTPQIQGNGFEDDQGFGWGLKRQVYPLFGAPVAIGGSGALYRYFLPDLYCYNAGVRHGHQVYGPHTPLGHEGQYAVGSEETTTFYYGRPEPSLVLTDSIDIGKTGSEKKHAYKSKRLKKLPSVRWWYEGDENNVLHPVEPLSDEGYRVKESHFTVQIDTANQGIRLRRRTDKANGRQLAAVYVDGALVTERPWYTVDYDTTYRSIRWFDADIDIAARYTKGKKQVRIRLVYKSADKKGIDEYYYWVFSRR